MSDVVTVTIDGKTVEARKGQTILDVARQLNIEIPALCYHQALDTYGACRLCVVEASQGKWKKVVTACNYEVWDGLEVATQSDRVRRSRKMTIELLLSRCPDIPILKRYAEEYGLAAPRFPANQDNCILCGLCVRICKERMGVGAADFVGRGAEMKVDTPYHRGSDVCMTCGACEYVCPTGAHRLHLVSTRKAVPQLSEFDMQMRPRSSIYIPFPQALPNVPVIDRDNCVHFKTGACKTCEQFCPAGAIDYSQEDEMVELDAGAVILAPGYCLFDAGKKLELGLASSPNVLSSLQFERMLSASGPSGGKILRPSDRAKPGRIAFIQCVGSRDHNHDYCSSVCCMYATKEAIIAMEHEEGLNCQIFYMDLRAFGKGFDAYYERAKELGVVYTRCRPSAVEEIPDTGKLRIRYQDGQSQSTSTEFDMVVLSTGLCPPTEVRELARKLGVALDGNGFARTNPLSTVETSRPGVYVCGPFSEPKDIPETVIEAGSASARAMAALAGGRGTQVTRKEWPPETDVRGQPPRIGIFVCHCGKNIAGVVNVPEVRDFAKGLPDVIHVEDSLYTCSIDTQELIKKSIAQHKLNRIIVASCTPRTHEPLFRETVRQAGLNPYLFEMANIRDQCSWVHMREPGRATEKAKELVRMAVYKSRLLEPLYSISISVKSGALVLGGGMAGITAALNLARQGFDVALVERESELGGNLRSIRSLLGGGDPQQRLADAIEQIGADRRITVFLNARVEAINGFVGNFTTRIAKDDGTFADVEHGAIIVATGAREHTPTEYGYGANERIVTQNQLEEKLSRGGLEARRVVMIQCVGSREGDRMYCSRVCCSQAVKNALAIKKAHPETDVFVLYREMRCYGFREKYYTEARQRGVRFVRYEVEAKPTVLSDGGKLRVRVADPILKHNLLIDTDLVVLAPAIVPRDDTEVVAQMLKVPLTRDNFFLEAHMKLRPVDCSVDGVYLAGLAHAPKNLDEAISQAEAAAGRAATVISKDEYVPEAIVSSVAEDVCAGCGICVSVCSYDAPQIVTVRGGKRRSRINMALCKGCGACASACPSGAAQQRGFRPKQIQEMVSAALE